MEFSFYVSKVLPIDDEGIVVLNAATFGRTGYLATPSGGSIMKPETHKQFLAEILDKMGEASSLAQGLKATITSYSKFIASGDNKLYMKVENNKVCGLLKVGRKNLFHYDGTGKVKELRPLCVLDFYVHESVQRLGYGRTLFEKMLECEKVEPRKLAYDRPSPKLISFLKRHYGLASYVPQNNNFVVFNKYWEDSAAPVSSLKNSDDMGYLNHDSGHRASHMKGVSQTNFHKVGKTIIDNPGLTLLKNDKNNSAVGYSNPSHTAYGSLGRKPESMGRASALGREIEPTEIETRTKLREDVGRDYKEKPEKMTVEKEKPDLRQPSSNQPYRDYQLRAPWASYGGTADPYRSSHSYGTQYGGHTYGARK